MARQHGKAAILSVSTSRAALAQDEQTALWMKEASATATASMA
jgi:hypothetical protein